MREAIFNTAAQKNTGRILVALILLTGLMSAQTPRENNSTRQARQPREVLVSISDRKLAVLENGQVLRIFDVAVGAHVSPSPIGEFQIVSRVANPTYYHAGKVIPAGAGNPIGPRWLGLSKKGYGIHGTNDPNSIGRAASHGCIRLRNSDIKQLYSMLAVGDVVEIRGERDQQIAETFGGPLLNSESTFAQLKNAAQSQGQ